MIPPEVAEACAVLALCERFGKLPSELDQESEDLLALLALEARGRQGAAVAGTGPGQDYVEEWG